MPRLSFRNRFQSCEEDSGPFLLVEGRLVNLVRCLLSAVAIFGFPLLCFALRVLGLDSSSISRQIPTRNG